VGPLGLEELAAAQLPAPPAVAAAPLVAAFAGGAGLPPQPPTGLSRRSGAASSTALHTHTNSTSNGAAPHGTPHHRVTFADSPPQTLGAEGSYGTAGNDYDAAATAGLGGSGHQWRASLEARRPATSLASLASAASHAPGSELSSRPVSPPNVGPSEGGDTGAERAAYPPAQAQFGQCGGAVDGGGAAEAVACSDLPPLEATSSPAASPAHAQVSRLGASSLRMSRSATRHSLMEVAEEVDSGEGEA
jgi:hypothetical protein